METTTLKKALKKEVSKNHAAPVNVADDQKKLQLEELKEALNNALDMVEGKHKRKSISDLLNG